VARSDDVVAVAMKMRDAELGSVLVWLGSSPCHCGASASVGPVSVALDWNDLASAVGHLPCVRTPRVGWRSAKRGATIGRFGPPLVTVASAP